MTKRAGQMLAALETGPKTRQEIYEHAGRYLMSNNAAAELRAAGYLVDCVRVDGEYVYQLVGRLDERPVGSFPPEAPGGPLVEPPTLTEGDVYAAEAREPSPSVSVEKSRQEIERGEGTHYASGDDFLASLDAVGEDGQLTLA